MGRNRWFDSKRIDLYEKAKNNSLTYEDKLYIKAILKQTILYNESIKKIDHNWSVNPNPDRAVRCFRFLHEHEPDIYEKYGFDRFSLCCPPNSWYDWVK